MARYFFTVKWPDKEHSDVEGTNLPDDEAAREFADRMISALREERLYHRPDY
jgi:hypothetical protein